MSEQHSRRQQHKRRRFAPLVWLGSIGAIIALALASIRGPAVLMIFA